MGTEALLLPVLIPALAGPDLLAPLPVVVCVPAVVLWVAPGVAACAAPTVAVLGLAAAAVGLAAVAGLAGAAGFAVAAGLAGVVALATNPLLTARIAINMILVKPFLIEVLKAGIFIVVKLLFIVVCACARDPEFAGALLDICDFSIGKNYLHVLVIKDFLYPKLR